MMAFGQRKDMLARVFASHGMPMGAKLYMVWLLADVRWLTEDRRTVAPSDAEMYNALGLTVGQVKRARIWLEERNALVTLGDEPGHLRRMVRLSTTWLPSPRGES